MDRRRDLALGIASAVLFFVLWFIGGQLYPNVFPPVPETFRDIQEVLTEPGPYGQPFYYHVYKTAEMIFLSLGIAMVLGTVFGIALGTNRRMESAVASWIYAWLALPSLVVVFLAGIWFGFGWTAGLFAVSLVITPFVVLNMWEGALNLDPELTEMAEFFGAGPLTRLRWVTLPQLIPHFFASLRSGLSIGWKITLLAETFLFTHGVGFMFKRAFDFLDLTMMTAWLIIFIVFLLILEYGIIAPLHRRVTHWRPDIEGARGAG